MINLNNLILQVSGPTTGGSATFTNIGIGPNTYVQWTDGTKSYATEKPSVSDYTGKAAVLTWSNGKKIKICTNVGAWSSSYGIYQLFTAQAGYGDPYWPANGTTSGKIWFEEVENNKVSMISLDIGYSSTYPGAYVGNLNIIEKDPDTNSETVIFSAGPFNSLAASKAGMYNADKPGVVRMIFGGGGTMKLTINGPVSDSLGNGPSNIGGGLNTYIVWNDGLISSIKDTFEVLSYTTDDTGEVAKISYGADKTIFIKTNYNNTRGEGYECYRLFQEHNDYTILPPDGTSTYELTIEVPNINAGKISLDIGSCATIPGNYITSIKIDDIGLDGNATEYYVSGNMGSSPADNKVFLGNTGKAGIIEIVYNNKFKDFHTPNQDLAYLQAYFKGNYPTSNGDSLTNIGGGFPETYIEWEDGVKNYATESPVASDEVYNGIESSAILTWSNGRKIRIRANRPAHTNVADYKLSRILQNIPASSYTFWLKNGIDNFNLWFEPINFRVRKVSLNIGSQSAYPANWISIVQLYNNNEVIFDSGYIGNTVAACKAHTYNADVPGVLVFDYETNNTPSTEPEYSDLDSCGVILTPSELKLNIKGITTDGNGSPGNIGGGYHTYIEWSDGTRSYAGETITVSDYVSIAGSNTAVLTFPNSKSIKICTDCAPWSTNHHPKDIFSLGKSDYSTYWPARGIAEYNLWFEIVNDKFKKVSLDVSKCKAYSGYYIGEITIKNHRESRDTLTTTPVTTYLDGKMRKYNTNYYGVVELIYTDDSDQRVVKTGLLNYGSTDHITLDKYLEDTIAITEKEYKENDNVWWDDFTIKNNNPTHIQVDKVDKKHFKITALSPTPEDTPANVEIQMNPTADSKMMGWLSMKVTVLPSSIDIEHNNNFWIGKSTVENHILYNHNDIMDFYKNEFKYINNTLYGGVYFYDTETKEYRKAWVRINREYSGEYYVANKYDYYQFYKNRLPTKRTVDEIFNSNSQDGMLDYFQTWDLFDGFNVQVLGGGEYGGAIYRVYPVINDKVHVCVNMSVTTASSGTTTMWSNANQTKLNMGIYLGEAYAFLQAAKSTGAITTTSSGGTFNGCYYGGYGGGWTSGLVASPEAVKWSITFTGKYSNGSYYQSPYIMCRTEGSDYNTYYLGVNQSSTRSNVFKIVDHGTGIVNTSCIQGLIAIPYHPATNASRNATRFKIDLRRKDEIIYSTDISCSSYRGFWIDPTNGITELLPYY